MKNTISWQLLTLPFNEQINNTLQQQHHAAQFISLAGRYLLPKKIDGSQINMQFLPEREMLIGNQHPDGWFIGVQLKNLGVQILDENRKVAKEILLDGKEFSEAFQEFKIKLKNNGVDVSELKTRQPYELSANSLKKNKYFSNGLERVIKENIHYRNNAELIINQLATEFKDIEPVRIWPHHFDTGTFVTLVRNEKGAAAKTIGLGWTIPDGMVTEPYFYLSFWSETPIEIENNPELFKAGKWMMPNWNGAVLKVSEILTETTSGSQYNLVKSFFKPGLKYLKEKLI